jgi:pantoate--beta-alanine ligase
MEVIHCPDEMRRWTLQRRSDSRRLGMVPTMGALHVGHLSLVRQSKQQCDATIATIFVNPTQFGPGEDFDQYPRTLEKDLQLLESEQVDAVFVPAATDIYPPGFSTYVDPPAIARSLEGEHRPTHFRGVTTIVAKLFLAAPVTHAFFGRKDYQQWKVIEALARDLNMGITIVPCEIVREPNGLAMSSRNRYLSDSNRIRALLLSQALQAVQHAVDEGERSSSVLAMLMRQSLTAGTQRVDKIDYAVVVDAHDLTPIEQLDRPAVALIAAWVGETRLLDNRIIDG